MFTRIESSKTEKGGLDIYFVERHQEQETRKEILDMAEGGGVVYMSKETWDELTRLAHISYNTRSSSRRTLFFD